MSTVINSDAPINTTADVQDQGAPEAAPDNALSDPGEHGCDLPGPVTKADSETTARMAKDDAAINRIVKLAVQTLDPKDALKKYARLGREVFEHAVWQKHQLAAWNAEDLTRLCNRLADQVKLQVAIKDVRMDVYVRGYLWVEAVKPLVPGVDKLSWYQVQNKFLPMMSFNAKALEGHIKLDWVEFVKTHVARQVSGKPLPIKELDAAIAGHKAALEQDALANRTPGEVYEDELDALTAKVLAARAEKTKVREMIATSVDEALGGVLTPAEVMGIVEQSAKDRNVNLPAGNAANMILDNAATMTAGEARAIARALNAAGNIDAIIELHKTLDSMVKAIQTAGAALQANAA